MRNLRLSLVAGFPMITQSQFTSPLIDFVSSSEWMVPEPVSEVTRTSQPKRKVNMVANGNTKQCNTIDGGLYYIFVNICCFKTLEISRRKSVGKQYIPICDFFNVLLKVFFILPCRCCLNSLAVNFFS